MTHSHALSMVFCATLAAACGSPSNDGPASSGGSWSGDGGEAGSSSGATGSSGGGATGSGGAATSSSSSGSSPASGAVDLGLARDYAILAKLAIATVPPSTIMGDLGVSPTEASAITGFSLAPDYTHVFATSSQVIGKVYAASFAAPTPSNLAAAMGDMDLALAEAAARAPDVAELGAGDIGGMSLRAGVYRWSTGLRIPVDLTLRGSSTDVWIFQIAEDLVVRSAARIALTEGARAQNVFWQVDGVVELDTAAHLEGIVLARTSITLRTGATVSGRLLAETTVSLDASAVVEPVP